MIRRIAQWLAVIGRSLIGESQIPSPPFKASKRTATIMYGLWYGRLTPDEARAKAKEWGFAEESIERMIEHATAEPSYWSQNTPPGQQDTV